MLRRGTSFALRYVLTACFLTGLGRPAASDLISLDLVAYDHGDNPVPDLCPEDIRLTDNGKPQKIDSFQLNQTRQRQPVVVFFDLLNSRMAGRDMVKREIVQSFRQIESGDNLYLYLLT